MSEVNRRRFSAAVGAVLSAIAGCLGFDSVNEDEENEPEADIDHDPNSEGRAELVSVEIPDKINVSESLPVKITAQEVTGEGSATIWPTVAMYDVDKEIRQIQTPQLTAYANEEIVWDEAFLIGYSINGLEALSDHPGTLLIDIEGHVETVEVVWNGE